MQRWEPMGLNFEGLEIQKLNISADRAQTVNEKNGVICLVTMFTPRVTVIKMSRGSFLHFLLMPAKLVRVRAKYLYAFPRK